LQTPPGFPGILCALPRPYKRGSNSEIIGKLQPEGLPTKFHLAKKVPLSIIVPTFNEEESIAEVLDAIEKGMAKESIDYEVIVVDDGSTDKTLEIVRSREVKIVRHDHNKGYGASLKSGIAKASHDVIVITDADGTYPASDIPVLFRHMKADGYDYDMVVGARTGQHVKIPLFRRPAKWFLREMANYLSEYNIPDLNSGLRIFKKELIERFFCLLPDGFSFTTTITIAALTNGYLVKFVPINYYERKGHSSIKPLRDFLGFTSLVVRLIVYFKPLNFFLPASLILLVIGLSKALIDFLHQNYFGVGAAIAILAAIQIGFLGLLADLVLRRTKL
jgi:glycosyltransferase involved in cell wall biosynthesis